MTTINSFSRSRIKNIQLNSFNDKCTVDVYSSGSNSYGEIVKTYTSGSEIACGYKYNAGAKSYGEAETRKQYSAIFRIDENTDITTNDKITIKKISGSAITPVQYLVVAIENGMGVKIIGANFEEV